MLYLRQSTASQSVLIGPFVDETDGNTAETGLTIDAADIRLSKNGANIVGKNSGGGTHDELGYYAITLDATDTDTVGRLQLMVHESGALPVYHEFQVLEEAAFDAIFASSAAPATAAGVTAVETDTQDIQSRLPAALVSGRIDASVGAMAANTLTASALAADAVTEIQSGLATVSGVLTTQMTEAYAANGVAPTLAQAIFAIHQMLMQMAISGTSVTVRKLDNATPAFVVTLDDADAPTSAVRV